MRKLSFLLLICATVLCSCSNKNGESVTPSGYNITWLNAGSGSKPSQGDMAFVHVYAYLDSVLQNSTRQNDRVLPVRVYSEEELLKMKEENKPNPIYEAVYMMSVGDSISIIIPITDGLRTNPQLANANEMKYHIVMQEAKPEAAYKEEQATLKKEQEEKQNAAMARVENVADQVTDIVAQYSSGNLKDKLVATESGLKYMKLKEGNGPATKVNGNVTVHYYGVLTNGEMFDNSFKGGQPFTFSLGTGQVIKGWDEGVALLKGGDQAVLFIPSELGYGKAGGGGRIPGDSELIFYIEVL